MDIGAAFSQHVHPKYFHKQFNFYLHDQLDFLELLQNCLSDNYKRVVLKWFIDLVEKSEIELDGEIAAAYAMVITAGSKNGIGETELVCYKTKDIKVLSKESPWVIAGNGSTGHRTWEAALCLGDYALKTIGEDKKQVNNFLELGAGTGLVGLLMSQMNSKNRVILTDGDEQVVEMLKENIALNSNTKNVTAEKLYWGEEDDESKFDNFNDGVILCADVTYESGLIHMLVQCLWKLLKKNKYALLGATLRSQETFAQFEKECEEMGIKMEMLKKYSTPFDDECCFFVPPENPNVLIYKLTC